MELEEIEKKVQAIERDLKYCESLLNKEARMEFAKMVLEELSREVRKLLSRNIPEALRSRLSSMELKIRILYHRANALLSLQEE